jgi:hypothetical protein
MNFCISPLVSNGLVVVSTLAKFEDKNQSQHGGKKMKSFFF